MTDDGRREDGGPTAGLGSRCPVCGANEAEAHRAPCALEVVGHKSFYTGEVGPQGFPVLRHEPLTRGEAEAILAAADKAKAERARRMPTEQDAINAMQDAYVRLTELGWRDAIYCPKDGSTFDVVTPGSTGIFPCYYGGGEWPKGGWWIADAGDTWPAHPVLFRARAKTQEG